MGICIYIYIHGHDMKIHDSIPTKPRVKIQYDDDMTLSPSPAASPLWLLQIGPRKSQFHFTLHRRDVLGRTRKNTKTTRKWLGISCRYT